MTATKADLGRAGMDTYEATSDDDVYRVGYNAAGDQVFKEQASGVQWKSPAQTIGMNDAAVTLILTGTAGAGEVKLTSNTLIVDPEGNNEDLNLPAEALCAGLELDIYNSGGEHIVVKDDGGSTIITIEDTEWGRVWCDGTSWVGKAVAAA